MLHLRRHGALSFGVWESIDQDCYPSLYTRAHGTHAPAHYMLFILQLTITGRIDSRIKTHVVVGLQTVLPSTNSIPVHSLWIRTGPSKCWSIATASSSVELLQATSQLSLFLQTILKFHLVLLRVQTSCHFDDVGGKVIWCAKIHYNYYLCHTCMYIFKEAFPTSTKFEAYIVNKLKSSSHSYLPLLFTQSSGRAPHMKTRLHGSLLIWTKPIR